MARRLDEQPAAVELEDEGVPAPPSSGSGLTLDGRRILAAIDGRRRASARRSTWCGFRG
jgi:RNA polymerase sigma-70 factor (ECF subfamily)